MSTEYDEHVNGCVNCADEQRWLDEEIEREANTPSDLTIQLGDDVEGMYCLGHVGKVVYIDISTDESRFDFLTVADANGVETEGYRWEWKRVEVTQ